MEIEILLLAALFVVLLVAFLIARGTYRKVKPKTPYALAIAIITFVVAFAFVAFLTALLLAWLFPFER